MRTKGFAKLQGIMGWRFLAVGVVFLSRLQLILQVSFTTLESVKSL